MRKILCLLIFSVFIFSSVAFARPMQVGGSLSTRYYNNWIWTDFQEGIGEAYEASPAAGIELFLNLPVLDNVDAQLAVENIFFANVKDSEAPKDYGFGYTSISFNGIVNWGNFGSLRPYFGGGLNLAQINQHFDDELSNHMGMGYQFFAGVCFEGGFKGEIGWALLNSPIAQGDNIAMYTNVPYFKFGYVFDLK